MVELPSSPERAEQLRRSMAMLAPGAPALNREEAMALYGLLVTVWTGRPSRSAE